MRVYQLFVLARTAREFEDQNYWTCLTHIEEEVFFIFDHPFNVFNQKLITNFFQKHSEQLLWHWRDWLQQVIPTTQQLCNSMSIEPLRMS